VKAKDCIALQCLPVVAADVAGFSAGMELHEGWLRLALSVKRSHSDWNEMAAGIKFLGALAGIELSQ
jgi:hypothetical protein